MRPPKVTDPHVGQRIAYYMGRDLVGPHHIAHGEILAVGQEEFGFNPVAHRTTVTIRWEADALNEGGEETTVPLHRVYEAA